MAKVLIFNICLVLILSGVESCFIPGALYVVVPNRVENGHYIATVEVADCDTQSMHFTLEDLDFIISNNGEIQSTKTVLVPIAGRTFSVWVQDNSGPKSEMVVHLVRSELPKKESTEFLKRSKRRWSPPPFNILENDKGPYPREIEKIVSDSEAKQEVYYTLSGHGVDQHPVGVFSLDKYSGMLSVHKSVDREEFPSFTLTTRVFNRNTNAETDLPLDINILVDDVNDNAPTFKDALQFTVLEQSAEGEVVGKVNAVDRDLERSLHVKIKYSLTTGSDWFIIHPETGVITTKTRNLDRETQEKHLVTVVIKDMDGAANGLSNTGTATITVGDINDNAPTFKESAYAATVKENEGEKLILRIPVQDKDLVNTPNWKAKFAITKGNENGNFRIDTDPNTNEGLLYVAKPLDFEKNSKVNLEIQARNEAELKGTTDPWVSVPVVVSVVDEDEGPEFSAPVVRFTVKENLPNGTVIGSYTAVDPETKSSNGIMYYKLSDPGSWIDVDKFNGELKVANTIDRESPFVQNGIYNITMKAVDAKAKTGTGTVILIVEDVNDNVPTIPTSELVVCEKQGQLGSVLVVAEDNDQSPFSAPFSFSLPKDHDGEWSLTRFNDTATTLQQLKELPTGTYEVPVEVTDLQGAGKKQTAKVRICQCRNGACPAKERSMSLGPLALLAMLLPLALLLLLGLLLAFFCVTKRDKQEVEYGGDSGGILLKSNTEAPGDEVDSSLINVPIAGVDSAVKGSVKGLNTGWMGNMSTSTMGGLGTADNGMYNTGVVTSEMNDFYSSQYDQYGTQKFGGTLQGSGVNYDNRFIAQDSSYIQNWNTNGRYLQQRLVYFGEEEDGRYAGDLMHSYGFEGVGSEAGSVGCCSEFGNDDNLDFVNTLGPKFKTLGEVCRKT
ncbi:desmocollin 2-like protein [Centropristis striata]|uniref:desmocollin 2-like protein n=1 Tax=Centropristis striata TaxID=184440 RepID=UPI0027DF7C5C|nr:desmocollin 2-like protein [Centropristis striata]